jgi:UDP-N-acetylmuramoyl-L-alanyl-D-glutamate--2,6-diaminopimelate ligase
MDIKIEKFPLLKVQGRKLVWDSRQEASADAELVVLPADHIEPELRDRLRARSNALFVGARGSGLDIEVDEPRRHLGELASSALGNPSRKLAVYGVTGTNGKTTCASLLTKIFVEARKTVCEIGTLGVRIWREGRCELELETGFTTPEAPTLHHLLFQLVRHGIESVVMEVSSHALSLGRIGGLDLDGALFTNLTQDHLDFHGSMKNYEDAKTRLFTDYLARSAKLRKTAVINTRDAAGARIFGRLPLGLGSVKFEAGKTFEIGKSDLSGLEVALEGDVFRSPMVGEFNAENLVGCVLLAERGAHIERKTSLAAVSRFAGAPGRLERVLVPGASERFVFVDYAHTPDALEKVLQTLAKVRKRDEKLVVLFGCGGDRDRGKRSQMGAIAARLADRVVLSSDNPRTEDPLRILAEIESGVPRELRAKVEIVEDRRKAIVHAISSLSQGDVCVVAGKGHETYQIVGQTKLPFSDLEACRAALASS